MSGCNVPQTFVLQTFPLVSWNFRHIVNLGKIRLFNAVNLEQGYGLIEIRAPREVLADEDVL